MRHSPYDSFRWFAHRLALAVGAPDMTIITFLVVFVIQNTQNRDAEVVHLKLDSAEAERVAN